MGNSSTQFPFMLAALIAVMFHAVVSEPNLDTKNNSISQVKTVQQSDKTVATMLVSTPAKTKQ